jgi:hypothetical protein
MKRLIHIVSIAPLLAWVSVTNVAAAGPYDGDWSGVAVSNVRQCRPASITLKVRGRNVTGEAKFEQGAPSMSDSPNINGTVLEDGHFGGTIGFQRVAGQFVVDGFEGTFRSSDCAWKIDLKRTSK